MIRPGALFREAWALYRAHWRHLVAVAFVVYVLLSLFTLVLSLLLDPWPAFWIGAFVALAGYFWVQGALVEAVADVRDGRADLSLSQTLERTAPRVNALGVTGVLAALGIALGTLFFLVPGLVLLTWWSLIVPVIVLEGRRWQESFGRSRELVRGEGWNVFGVVLLTFLVQIGVSVAVSLLLSPLQDDVQAVVSSIVSPTLWAPFVAVTWTLMYYRLRETRASAPARVQ